MNSAHFFELCIGKLVIRASGWGIAGSLAALAILVGAGAAGLTLV